MTNGNNKSDARIFVQSTAIYSHAYIDLAEARSPFSFSDIWLWTGKEGREEEGVFVIHPQALLNFASEE